MSRQVRLLPSLLDRLLDERPGQATESAAQRAWSLDAFKASIVRDLEILVNTRQALVATGIGAYPVLEGTLLDYGMPDFTGKSLLDPQARNQIRQQLEKAICTGDRRFSKVRVQLLAQKTGPRMLTFHVDAVLQLQDIDRRVSFDAVLQINSQQYKVQNLN